MQITYHLINESMCKVITIILLLSFAFSYTFRGGQKGDGVVFCLLGIKYIPGFPVIIYGGYEQDLF